MNREDVAMAFTFENLDILRKEVEAAKLLLSECDEIFIEEGISNIELRGYLSGKLSADEVIELLDPPAEQRNQCDGCQAGIPLVDGAHRMGRPGGYPDLMSCQKERYEHLEQAEGTQGELEAIPDKGPWHAVKWDGGKRVDLSSDDFAHDVALTVSGDFATADDKFRYAEQMAAWMNAALAQPYPTRNAHTCPRSDCGSNSKQEWCPACGAALQ